MASYPGAVKTFTTRNAGDVIQPSHVNDLQDEVNAIEAGLLQGSAPLNSSNSTVASLSVTGNCTVVGSIIAASQSRCELFQGSTFSLAAGTWGGIPFNTENINVGPIHSTSVNSSRITFASNTGTYLFFGMVTFDAVASTALGGLRIVKNDTTDISGRSFGPLDAAGGAGPTLNVTTMAVITSTADYVSLYAFQGSASTLSILQSRFVAYRLPA